MMDKDKFISFFKTFDNHTIKVARNTSLKMGPINRDLRTPPNANPIISSVLLLTWFEHNELFITFIKRTEDNGVHSGQIAFPGGRFDSIAGDIDTYDTAIRETHEEIGIAPHAIKIIGKLSLLSVPVSKFLIHPFVGYIPHKPEFSLNKSEVEELISIKLADILSQKHEHYRVETFDGEIEAPCYIFDKHVIWGATSMMIAELVAILKHYDFRREEH